MSSILLEYLNAILPSEDARASMTLFNEGSGDRGATITNFTKPEGGRGAFEADERLATLFRQHEERRTCLSVIPQHLNPNTSSAKQEDVIGITSIIVDDDTPRDKPRADNSFPVAPTFVVESSKGKFHYYWLIEGLWFIRDSQTGEVYENRLADFKNLHSVLQERYGADPAMKNERQPIRIPGSYHNKLDTPRRVELVRGQLNGTRYRRETLLEAFGVDAWRQDHVSESEVLTEPYDLEDIRLDEVRDRFIEMFIMCDAPPDVFDGNDYSQWLSIAWSLKRLFANNDDAIGFDLLDKWSAHYANYDADKVAAKWAHLEDDKNPDSLLWVLGFRGLPEVVQKFQEEAKTEARNNIWIP